MVSLANFLALVASILASCWAQTHYDASWASLDTRPLPAWYDKAKIGIFVHWGVYSVPAFGHEWFAHAWLFEKDPAFVNYMKKWYPDTFKYQDFAPQWKAEFYNPNEWAEMFKKAGAKYAVLTSKHHEGFTLWPSKHSPGWNAMEVGPKRDLVGDFVKAMRAHNLVPGLYYSLLEWLNPTYQHENATHFATHDYVTNKVRPELEDLVSTYQPHLLFSDGDIPNDAYYNSTHFLQWLYNESPVKNEIVTNDRWGLNVNCHHGDYLTCKDRWVPGSLQNKKWENAMTLYTWSWGYRRDASLSTFFTIDQLIQKLVSTIAFGGNILMNVGPRADGKIDPLFEERLMQMGDWLKVNGEAIYESHPWTHQEDSKTKEVYYTQRAGHVYGMLVGYKAKIEFGSVEFDSVQSIHLLGHDAATIPFHKSQDGSHVALDMPILTPLSQAKIAYTFRFELKK